MADFNYQLTLQDIGKKLVNLETDTINVVLLTAAYTAVAATDHFLSDIPSGARVATVTLASKTFANGVFDAADVTFTAPAAGATVTQAVIYQDGSPESGARLIRKISSTSYSGFPFTTNGADVSLAWPNDANKIFAFVNA